MVRNGDIDINCLNCLQGYKNVIRNWWICNAAQKKTIIGRRKWKTLKRNYLKINIIMFLKYCSNFISTICCELNGFCNPVTFTSIAK